MAREALGCARAQGRRAALFAVRDVALHLADRNGCGVGGKGGAVGIVRRRWAAVDVDPHDVAGDALVSCPIVIVAHDEDHVEAAEDGGLEVNVVAGRLEVVVTAKDGVGRREHGRARVEDGSDAGLGDGDCLLLHGFVDGDAVLVAHLVELVDADDAAVREDHGATLEVELARVVVTLHRGREAGRGRALA